MSPPCPWTLEPLNENITQVASQLERLAPLQPSVVDHGCLGWDTWNHATSYCETAVELVMWPVPWRCPARRFQGPFAYTSPETQPIQSSGEPSLLGPKTLGLGS